MIRPLLPRLYVITPEPQDINVFLHRLEGILEAGARLVQLRAKTLGMNAYSELAARTCALCECYGATLLLNATPDMAQDHKAMGVHLSSPSLLSLNERPLARDKWVAASCHSVAELTHAARIGVDFVVISPVLATASHPHARCLGWEGLRTLVGQVDLPVYALGGMKSTHMAQALRCGAQGIATLSAVWDAKDLDLVMRQCLVK